MIHSRFFETGEDLEIIEPDDVLLDARPRTLYVRRDVMNAEAIAAHFAAQGLADLQTDEFHVTIAYSKTPVDWMRMGEDYPSGSDEDGNLCVKPGGVRLVERLGESAVVMMFTSSALSWRHQQMREAGATWQWDDFQPHVTLSWNVPRDFALDMVEPWRGEIELGPEIFEEINEDWRLSKDGLPFYFDAFDPTKHPRHPKGSAQGGEFASVQGGQIGDLERHTAMRDYTEKELDWEYEREYKVYSKPHFPTAFSSRADFQEQYDRAPLRHLTLEELRNLGNSMAASGYKKGEAWVHKTFSHRRDTKRILDDMKNKRTAPPIILQRGGKLWLMAGQTRLATGLALGRSIPAKVIPINTRTADYDPNQPRDPGGEDGGQWISGGHSLEMSRPEDLNDTESEEVTSWVRQLQRETLIEDLSSKQRREVEHYSLNEYKPINDGLRQGILDGADDRVARLDEAIASARLPIPLEVYRAAGANTSKRLMALPEGAVFRDLGFVSTSLADDGTAEFAGRAMKIRVPRGFNALPLNGLSAVEEELEVLLPRNTQFRVVRSGSNPQGLMMEVEVVR